MSFTGCWDLDHELSSSQSEFLKAMGRPYWQRVAVDKADERFRLMHFALDGGEMNFVDKDVKISLANKIVKVLSAITRIEFDKVHYAHKLTCNGKEVKHEDDEKRFGPCLSRTSWETEGFVIRWYLANGLLKVSHSVNPQGNFMMVMTFTDGVSQKETTATKVYRRGKPTPEDLKYFLSHPYRTMIVGMF